jgi:hypothetical protein
MSRAECSDCTRVFICGGRNVPTVRNDPRTGEKWPRRDTSSAQQNISERPPA